YHTADLLPNGKLLVAGGVNALYGCQCTNAVVATAEVLDIISGSFAPPVSLPIVTSGGNEVLLPNGRVLFANSTDLLYDSVAGTFSFNPAGNLLGSNGTVVLLPNGKVLHCGGSQAGIPF